MDVMFRFAIITVCRLFADARYFTGATAKGEAAIRAMQKQFGGKLPEEFKEIWLKAKNATNDSTREGACRAARAWLISNYELTPEEFSTDKERKDGTAVVEIATTPSPGRPSDEGATPEVREPAADSPSAIGVAGEDPAAPVEGLQGDS